MYTKTLFRVLNVIIQTSLFSYCLLNKNSFYAFNRVNFFIFQVFFKVLLILKLIFFVKSANLFAMFLIKVLKFASSSIYGQRSSTQKIFLKPVRIRKSLQDFDANEAIKTAQVIWNIKYLKKCFCSFYVQFQEV